MASNSKTTDQTRIDFLWKVLARYDAYITSTNTKAALVGTFATFLLGTIVFKWKDVEQLFAGHPKLTTFAAVCVGLAAASSVAALGFAFAAVHPFLSSSKKPGQYHSDIFFMHVMEYQSCDDYHAAISERDDSARVIDLCNQVHAIAKGLGLKMLRLQRAMIGTFISLLGLLLLILALLIRAFV